MNQMSWEEKLLRANTFYRRGFYDEAIVAYTAALLEVPDDLPEVAAPLAMRSDSEGDATAFTGDAATARLGTLGDLLPTPPPPPPPPRADVERAKILSNRAQAAAQLRDPERAASDCAAALAYDPTNAKAAVRRALALEQLGHLGAALEQLDGNCRAYHNQAALARARRLDNALGRGRSAEERVVFGTMVGCRALAEWGLLPASLSRVAAAARRRVQSMQAQDKILLKSCRDHETLINDQQTLRLHLASAIPARVEVPSLSLIPPPSMSLPPPPPPLPPLSHRHFCLSVRIANEFGLWRAKDFASLLRSPDCDAPASPPSPRTLGGVVRHEAPVTPPSLPFVVRLRPQNEEARRRPPTLRIYRDGGQISTSTTAGFSTGGRGSERALEGNIFRVGASGRGSVLVEVSLDGDYVYREDPVVFLEVASVVARAGERERERDGRHDRDNERSDGSGERHMSLTTARSIMPVLTLPITITRLLSSDRFVQYQHAVELRGGESSGDGATGAWAPRECQLRRQICAEEIGAHSCRVLSLASSSICCYYDNTENGNGEDEEQDGEEARGGPIEVVVAESPGHLGIGGKVWDAALVLLQFLRTPASVGGGRAFVEGKRVLELGAGTGVVSLCCGLCLGAARVTITDVDDVCKLIDVNIRLNGLAEKTATGNGNHGDGTGVELHTVATPLVWSDPPPRSMPSRVMSVDTVLLSDVVYDPELYVPLVATLSELVHPPSPGVIPIDVILAWRHRNPEDFRFWAALEAAGFSHTEIRRGEGIGGACMDVRVFIVRRLHISAAGVEGGIAAVAATATVDHRP